MPFRKNQRDPKERGKRGRQGDEKKRNKIKLTFGENPPGGNREKFLIWKLTGKKGMKMSRGGSKKNNLKQGGQRKSGKNWCLRTSEGNSGVEAVEKERQKT